MNNDSNDQRDQDINAQATAAGTTPERLQKGRAQQAGHATQASDQQTSAAPGKVNPDRLQDGYGLNQGSDYSAQPSEEEQQDNYDPTHSGVRHAQNKPGMRTNNPGREGQGGWAEQLQGGQTSDTPNRKNPAD
ncbi:MAG: hypothetical protein NVS2B12_28020 [Ktedonobacteraceae bacterium]